MFVGKDNQTHENRLLESDIKSKIRFYVDSSFKRFCDCSGRLTYDDGFRKEIFDSDRHYAFFCNDFIVNGAGNNRKVASNGRFFCKIYADHFWHGLICNNKTKFFSCFMESFQRLKAAADESSFIAGSTLTR